MEESLMAHILGISAVVTFLLSFQFKTRKNIILVNLISRTLYILQYIFLGAFEGAVLDFLGFLFSFTARYKERDFITKNLKAIMIITTIILFAIGMAMYENVYSLFAIAGIVCEVLALWLTKEKNIKILSMFAAPGWMVYNLANKAYGSVVGNILVIVSIAVAIFRLDYKKISSR
jgi:hypothetical protein